MTPKIGTRQPKIDENMLHRRRVIEHKRRLMLHELEKDIEQVPAPLPKYVKPPKQKLSVGLKVFVKQFLP